MEKTALVLRTCNPDLTSHGGFKWPDNGPVACPDWDATPECGHGLHGLLWGEGCGELLNWSTDAKWLVVEVLESEIVQLGTDKVKFPRGAVVHCGDRKSATDYLLSKLTKSASVVGATVTAGYGGTATAGDRGTATAGDGGTATAGYGGTATAGDGGIATAGYGGTATAGYGGAATAGDGGTATAGDGGIATAGDRGTATAGDGGVIQLKFYDGVRYRVVTLYVGEDGILPNVKYKLDKGKPVKAN